MSGPGSCLRCGGPVLPDDRFCESCGERTPDPHDRVELRAADAGAVSDRGVRHRHNEDAVGLHAVDGPTGTRARLAVVCDGVSHGARPDLASRAAVSAALAVHARSFTTGPDPDPDPPADPEVVSRAAIASAVDAVSRLAGRSDTAIPPACTFVSVLLADGAATVASVGDSRVYWLPRDGEARALTVDDSWRTEVVAAGRMSEASAARDRRRNTITAWLGADAAAVDGHVTRHRLDAPGVLLACTDGLWNSLAGPADLADLVALGPPDPVELARHLVATALARGERDNVTAAVIVVPDPVPDLVPDATPDRAPLEDR